MPAGEHPSDDARSGTAPAADAAGGASGVSAFPDVLDAQAQHGCQHLVRPGAAPGHVLGGQGEVDQPPPAERVEHDAEQAAGQAGDHAYPDARFTQPLDRLPGTGNRRQPVPVDGRAERALERQCGGLGTAGVTGKQPAEHSDRGLAERLVDGDHVMRVVGRARHDALGGACLGEGTLKHAVVLRRGSEQAEACQRDRRPAAHLITPVHCSGARGRGLLVACGGFRPQVELGAIGLDLTPGREDAKPHQREQQQLLHGAVPFTLLRGAKPPRTAG